MSINDIVSGINTAVSGFSGGLQDLLLGMLKSAFNILFKPIDLLLSSLFSGLATSLTTVANRVTDFVFELATFPVSWFFNFLPPLMQSVLLIYVDFLILYYTFVVGYKALQTIIKIIHKIKLW